MTVIAWDGKTLAADRACNIGGVLFEVTKLRRIDGALYALAGDGTRLAQLMAWVAGGADPKDYPTRRADDDTVFVVIDRVLGKPRIRRFEATGFPMVIESRYYADGAGRDAALAAMICGRGARQAVEVACHITAYCGLGVDAMDLEE